MRSKQFTFDDKSLVLKYVEAAEKLGISLNPDMVHTIKSAIGK